MFTKLDHEYLIKLNPLKAMIIFSIPLMIGNLFQQTYSLVDSAIVGRYVGERALAAVGASYALTNIFICVAIGGGMGAAVIVSQHFGAKKYKDMKTSIYTSLITFLFFGILLGIFGVLTCDKIMVILKTPANCINMATEYLNIYFYGLPFVFLYNILAAMFNALGKSKIPLYFLIFSSVFNVILDLIFVIEFKMGVRGVAWATLIAQGISCIFSFFVLIKLLKDYYKDKVKYFDLKEVLTMLRIALPSILQQSTVSIGMMLVQSVVNSFGSNALAGYSIAMRVENLCIVPMLSIGNTVSAFAAQNIGAKKPDRVMEGYKDSYKMVLAFALFIFIIIQLFYKEIIFAFIGNNYNSVIYDTAKNYLKFISFFFCLIGFKTCVDGLLRGAGDMMVYTIANLVNLGIRVSIAMIFASIYGIRMVWIAIPIGWCANWLISFMQYKTGKWKKIIIH